MKHSVNVMTSVLASSLRAWRGTATKITTPTPEKTITLFDREGCPECRLVREALTELNLDVSIVPCPEGNRTVAQKLKEETGSSLVPHLIDPNSEKTLSGQDSIVSYLFKEYRGSQVPDPLTSGLKNAIASRLATTIRNGSGTQWRPAKTAEQPLTLYGFESSPYTRLVRERLCEYGIPYTLITLGKQQRADVGIPNLRLTLKKYKPVPNSKRDAFFNRHGNVQVPYLEDPNTQQALFESAKIMQYLDDTYGIAQT